MKRLVNGVESDLPSDAKSMSAETLGDRLLVRTPAGTYTAVAIRDGDATLISYKGRQFRIEKATLRRAVKGAATEGKLIAPMPGQVVDVVAQEGASVKKGERILVLEAMKVQQTYAAPFDGVIAVLAVKPGDQIKEGAVLAVVEPLI